MPGILRKDRKPSSEPFAESGRKRRICFVTGTRAEFGLMRSVLCALRAHRKLQLQLVVTGMHLDRRRGRSIDEIRRQGWTIDATVSWDSSDDSPIAQARQTGLAVARLARVYQKLASDVVLVVGDRVEAFAAASAAHVAQRLVAHVHGGDRAEGQVDDALRHAISKLAHVHFPATADSALRLVRLGEDRWRIFRAGSPGNDDIRSAATSTAELLNHLPGLQPRRFALIVLHPVDARDAVEFRNAQQVLRAVRSAGISQAVVVYPNNDPGAAGIVRCWVQNQTDIEILLPDVPRPTFLGLLREAAVLVGNSSSGIIEAASLGTRVVNIGPRQRGRPRGENITDVPYRQAAIRRAVAHVWNDGRPLKFSARRNPYGGQGAGRRIASVLADLRADARMRRKLIAY